MTPPDIGPRYTLIEEVGRGAFGAVWRATDALSGADVAVKILHRSTPEIERRFRFELEALVRVRNPNCVKPIDVGNANGVAFLATEFIDGPTLTEWLAQEPPMAERLRVAGLVARGLEAPHREGVVHRDLKPGNILIRPGGVPAIVDFGIAKLVGVEGSPRLTQTGEVIGTPGYMSPEQLRGQRDVGAPTDMYALGAILFLMLEGRPVFSGSTALEVAMRHLSDPVPLISTPIDPHIRTLVASLLDKEPARRPLAGATARRLLGEPEAVAADAETARQKLFGVLVIGLFAVVAAAVLLYEPEEETPPIPPPAVNPTALFEQPQKPNELTGSDASIPEVRACPGLRDFPSGVTEVHGVPVWIPPGYSTERRFPHVVVFADAYQSAIQAMNALDLPGVADGFVVVGLDFGDVNTLVTTPAGRFWRQQARWDHAVSPLERVRADLCLSDGVYAFGYGEGGYGALLLAAHEPGVRAIAAFAFRMTARDELPRRHHNTPPVLMMLPTDDATRTVSGTGGCAGVVPSLKAHVSGFKDWLECDSDAAEFSLETGTCVEHACATEFRTCVVKGDRRLVAQSHDPLTEPLGRALSRCPKGPIVEFPVSATAWEFFRSHVSVVSDALSPADVGGSK